jgi:hypothetical protein
VSDADGDGLGAHHGSDFLSARWRYALAVVQSVYAG